MSGNNDAARPSRFLDRVLGMIEKLGNALPHPGSLFALGAVVVVLLSGVMAQFDVEVTHPGTGDPIRPVSLMTVEGLHRIVTSMVTNFTGFAPLGTVLVAMLGIGIAERSGLISAVLRLLVLSSPRRMLTFVIVLAGVLSNAASEIGYVLLVPLGAVIFLAVGRHPVAGLAAAFAGVSGGYSANVVLGTIDPLLAGLSEEAARIVDPGYEVNPACNYYFMFVSTFFIAAVGTWVTERIVEPRLGAYRGEEKPEKLSPLTPAERQGLRWALVATLLFAGMILAGTLPPQGFLRELETGSVLRSPFLTGIVAFLFLGASAMGIAYGVGAGTIRNDSDVMNGMGKAIETLGVYMVLVFFAAQFVAYFNWTNLGLILAVKGARILGASGLGDIPLMIGVVMMAGMINLVMGSASAKWAILAPIFVPMFMLLGYTPEMIQAAYRVGDSVTNIISPMMSYFALIVAFVGRYEKGAGIGTVVATMLPYTIAFTVVWVILLSVWMLLGFPVGPGAQMYWSAPPW